MRLVALPLLLLATGVIADPAQTRIPDASIKIAGDLRDAALELDLGYQIVKDLTVEIGPRMAGSEADPKAVAWAVARMQSLGFANVRTEPVTFPRWQRGREVAELLTPKRQGLSVIALGGSVATPTDGIEGELVRFDSLDAIAALPEGALEGRIAWFSLEMPRTREGTGYGAVSEARVRGASIAASKGAIGWLMRSAGTDRSDAPHTGIMRYEMMPKRIPAAALSIADAEVIDAAIAAGETVKLRLTLGGTSVDTATSYNVIGEVTGASRPDEYVLIGAHLDSWDVGTGALDDGAGIGITFAAAHLIAQLPPAQRPARSIRVIAFANEEQGLFGGKAYFAAHKDQLSKHIIGAESDFGAGRVWRLNSRVKPEALAAVDQILEVLAPLGIERGERNRGGGPDLNALVYEGGMAALGLEQDGTGYFDVHHTRNDTLDKVDPMNLRQNVATYAVFAYLAASAEGDFGFAIESPRP